MPKKKQPSKNPTLTFSKNTTTWQLAKLFYTSHKDPAIEKDLLKTERAYTEFAKKYRNYKFWTTAVRLKTALEELERMQNKSSSSQPILYFMYRTELNAGDTQAHKELTRIEERLTKAANKILFFELTLGTLPKKMQKKYLADKSLTEFHYELKTIFEAAQHQLSEPEEKILSLKSDVSYGRWIAGTEKILNKRSITYKKKSIPLPPAFDRVNTVKRNERKVFWGLVTDELKSLAPVAENELNAIVLNKKISDELRGYANPYSATIKNYENSEAAVLSLVAAIESKGYALSKKYYKLKARALGVKQLSYAERSLQLGTLPTLDFKQSSEIAHETFAEVNPRYAEMFSGMLANGQIDVYPRQGKGGGAFCSHAVHSPTMVFLNQIDDVRSFTTLAHEMGHAIHSERSKKQPPRYQNYSTTTAETASTFFEGLAQERYLKTLPDKYKLAVLDFKISNAVATICRQIAFFNFELDIHTRIRSEGGLEWTEMADLFAKHMRAYMGPAVKITQDDGLSFVYVSHFRRFFYVYTYAYGELVSNIMADTYKQDTSYRKEIDLFLTSGGSDSVENIFANIGIDTTKTTTFMAGLGSLAADIKEFKLLVEKST